MTTVVQTSTTTGQPQQQQQVYPQGSYPGQPQQQQQQVYPQGSYPPQQPVFIQVPTTQGTTATGVPGGNNKYNCKAGLVTGILQICAGSTLVLLGIIVLVLGTWLRSGWNIWGGIMFYIVTGILGVVSKNKNTCVIVAYMVMCIISAVCAGGQMLYDCSAAVQMSHAYCSDYWYDQGYGGYGHDWCSNRSALVAMHALSSLAGFGEMIIAIVASAYCCCGVCGRTTASTQMTVVSYAQPAQHVQGGQVNVVQGSYPAPAQQAYPAPGSYPASGPYSTQGPYQQNQNPTMPPNQPPPAYMQQAPYAPPQEEQKHEMPK